MGVIYITYMSFIYDLNIKAWMICLYDITIIIIRFTVNQFNFSATKFEILLVCYVSYCTHMLKL